MAGTAASPQPLEPHVSAPHPGLTKDVVRPVVSWYSTVGGVVPPPVPEDVALVLDTAIV